MSLWKKIKGEFIDIVEWLDDTHNTMVYRFERYGNEIKYGAKLIVREGQAAVFINKGELADVFEPGSYELVTDNLPILSTLQGWKYGFESPFKAEVYFISTRQFTDQKWGTRNPIMLRDPEFGPVRLRAFGTYALKVDDPSVFLREIVGTSGDFRTEDVTDQLRNIIVSRFTDGVAEAKLAVLDLAANYDELGDFLMDKMQPEMAEYGLKLTKLLVENISLPAEVEKAMDQRTSMGVIGNLGAYTQFMAAKSMEAAAQNPSGGAASGMGMGMGFAMANQMAQSFQPGQQQQGGQQAQTTPPPPSAPQFHVAVNGETTGPFTLEALKQQAQEGTFTRSTMVWSQGFDGWKAAGEVDALDQVFGAVPPPPPPPPPSA